MLETSKGCKGPPAPAPAVKLPKKIAAIIIGKESVTAITRLASAAKNMMPDNNRLLPNRFPMTATISASKNVPAMSMLSKSPMRKRLKPSAFK
jgi:hypothetical protein